MMECARGGWSTTSFILVFTNFQLDWKTVYDVCVRIKSISCTRIRIILQESGFIYVSKTLYNKLGKFYALLINENNPERMFQLI